MTDNPKQVTIKGRLSFPTWTAQEAYNLSLKGKFPAKDVASAKPSVQLVLDDTQFQRALKHFTDVYLPYTEARYKANEKKDALEPKEVKALIDTVTGDLEDQVYNTPFKAVTDKTLELMPDAVAVLRVLGSAGVDLEQKAMVRSESDLLVPDPDLLSFPVVKPISQTVHQMYPGAWVAATSSLYSYRNGKLPGFSFGATTIVFMNDAERFGGGQSVDEDALFMLDD